jgi:hypothetical protein
VVGKLHLTQGGPVEQPGRGRVVRVGFVPGLVRVAGGGSVGGERGVLVLVVIGDHVGLVGPGAVGAGRAAGDRCRRRWCGRLLPGLAQQLGVLGPALTEGDDLGLEDGDHLVLVPDVVRGTSQHPVDLGHPVAPEADVEAHGLQVVLGQGPVVGQRAGPPVRV